MFDFKITHVVQNSLCYSHFGNDNSCYKYSYSEDLHRKSKREFLEKWFKCAQDNEKSLEIEMFSELAQIYSISSEGHEKSLY